MDPSPLQQAQFFPGEELSPPFCFLPTPDQAVHGQSLPSPPQETFTQARVSTPQNSKNRRQLVELNSLLGKHQHHILGNYWNFICLRLMTCNQRHCAKKAKIKYTLGRRRRYTSVTQEIRWTKEAIQYTREIAIFNSVFNKTFFFKSRAKKKLSNVYSRHKSYIVQKAFFQIVEHKVEKMSMQVKSNYCTFITQ